MSVAPSMESRADYVATGTGEDRAPPDCPSTAKRYCGCENGSCLDGPTPCPHVDAEGFRIGAKRRLKRTNDGLRDIDDGNVFKEARKGHLVPVLKGKTNWRSGQGFQVLRLLLCSR